MSQGGKGAPTSSRIWSMRVERRMGVAGQAILAAAFFLPICTFAAIAGNYPDARAYAWTILPWTLVVLIGAFLMRRLWRPRGCCLVWREPYVELWQQKQLCRSINLQRPHQLVIIIKEFVGVTNQAVPLPPRVFVEVYLRQGATHLSFDVGTRERGDHFVTSANILSLRRPFIENRERVTKHIVPILSGLSHLHCSVHVQQLKQNVWERLYANKHPQTEFEVSGLFLPTFLEVLEAMDRYHEHNTLLPTIRLAHQRPVQLSLLRKPH